MALPPSASFLPFSHFLHLILASLLSIPRSTPLRLKRLYFLALRFVAPSVAPDELALCNNKAMKRLWPIRWKLHLPSDTHLALTGALVGLRLGESVFFLLADSLAAYYQVTQAVYHNNPRTFTPLVQNSTLARSTSPKEQAASTSPTVVLMLSAPATKQSTLTIAWPTGVHHRPKLLSPQFVVFQIQLLGIALQSASLPLLQASQPSKEDGQLHSSLLISRHLTTTGIT